jgi:acetyltransferase-like isoleucine patch superfamily enzyme
MIKNKFSFIQRIRNKVRIKGNNHSIILEDGNKTNISNSKIYIKGINNKLHIKKNVRIKKINIEILGSNCSIIIGNNCILGYNTYLSAKGDNISILIDDNAMLSRNAKIMTSDGHPIYNNNKIINEAKSIQVGKNVWLGDNVTILKGITIGNGSIVGINSTLTKSIPSNVIATGSPATITKENIYWEH